MVDAHHLPAAEADEGEEGGEGGVIRPDIEDADLGLGGAGGGIDDGLEGDALLEEVIAGGGPWGMAASWSSEGANWMPWPAKE